MLSILHVAMMCHEANRNLCIALGDFSQKPWEDAEQWQKDSAFNGVVFNLQNPDAPASASHESWLEEKRATGWTYGPVKDAEKKEHPCFIPYEGLPKEQQAKDHLFKAVVAAMASLIESKPPAEDPCDGCDSAPVDCKGLEECEPDH